MTVYYTEYIAYQMYSNIPPQSQREQHMQMIAPCSRGRGGRGRRHGEVHCSDIILMSRWIHRELLCPTEKRKKRTHG
jgi:hypothetical protein